MFKSGLIAFVVSSLVALCALLFIYFHPVVCPRFFLENLSKMPSELEMEGVFQVPIENQQYLRIGIIGETLGDSDKEEIFNKAILDKLLEVLKKRDVHAIFFTGNMVSGSKNPVTLEKQLEAFTEHVKTVMDKVPFFAAMGNIEANLPQGTDIFRHQFHLEKGVSFNNNTFAYAVSMDQAFFAVIPTDDYTVAGKVEPNFNPFMLIWLQNVLKEASKDHKFLFVIGHEPAFPVAATENMIKQYERDEFWKILSESGVLAYFASHERLFDRSNRYHVWQIVSGGGGAPLKTKTVMHPFFHCLLLTIPLKSSSPPHVEILDTQGEINDEFELVPYKPILYQLHIN